MFSCFAWHSSPKAIAKLERIFETTKHFYLFFQPQDRNTHTTHYQATYYTNAKSSFRYNIFYATSGFPHMCAHPRALSYHIFDYLCQTEVPTSDITSKNHKSQHCIMDNKVTSRLDALRKRMAQNGIAATVIPQTDPHHGEYIADHWQLRRHLSGFTGSAGSLVVTADSAFLWTDSRYFLQATSQLEGSGIVLMKEGLLSTPSIDKYLASNIPAGSTVGIDGMLFSIDETRHLAEALAHAGIKLDTSFDPADTSVWPERPLLPQCEIYVHDIKYAGQSASDKIAAVLSKAAEYGATSVFVSALDEIAWTLNIRSNDVEYNPVATAHLYLSANGSVLFTDLNKITPAADAHLKQAGVECRPYGEILTFLASLPAEARVLLSASQSAGTVSATLGDRAVIGSSAVAMFKAVKNEVQIEGTRAAMLRDGAAMVRALSEITSLVAAGEALTEMDIPGILTRHRSAGDLYVEESFETIAGFGPHGAIVHYAARPDTNSSITASNLLLIDSGANYLDGTTDITRTISLGTPTPEQRHDFTLVMKGHIALAQAVFPEGTRGHQLDAMARMPLWKEGKLYLHGTGHGVGHFLNVHEGPHSIRLNDTGAPLMPGMITSNEPGLYLDGRYGIRCENLVLTIPAMETEFGRFFRFETLTLCPFDRALFDLSIMTPEEIKWVNDYHARVYDALSPLVDGDALTWLRNATLPL